VYTVLVERTDGSCKLEARGLRREGNNEVCEKVSARHVDVLNHVTDI
jgi:hypothetical protein